MSKKKLSDRHRAFADEYLSNGMNATQAYLTVYNTVTKKRTAEVNGNKLLSNTEVEAYIAEKQDELKKEAKMDRDFIINEYKELLASCKEEGVDGKGTIKDRTNWSKALAQITKFLGLDEAEKQEITHKGVEAINITINRKKDNEDNEDK